MPRRLAIVFACILFSVTVLHVTGVFSTDRIGGAIPFFCPFKALTGIPCPGCGMTRAILSITKGDFQGAIGYNPFSFFLLFMVVISIVPGKQAEKLPSIVPIVMNYFFIVVLVAVIFYWFFACLLPLL
jgi:Protein of unknown function (DUF2752)